MLQALTQVVLSVASSMGFMLDNFTGVIQDTIRQYIPGSTDPVVAKVIMQLAGDSTQAPTYYVVRFYNGETAVSGYIAIPYTSFSKDSSGKVVVDVFDGEDQQLVDPIKKLRVVEDQSLMHEADNLNLPPFIDPEVSEGEICEFNDANGENGKALGPCWDSFVTIYWGGDADEGLPENEAPDDAPVTILQTPGVDTSDLFVAKRHYNFDDIEE